MGQVRGGFSQVSDNVIRRQAFERQHPSVVIRHHKQPAPWHWVATWPGGRVVNSDLGLLLDALAHRDLP